MANRQKDSKSVIMLTYVWSFSNIGDSAITPGALNLLYNRFPDYEMAVVGFGTDTNSYKAYLGEGFPECHIFGFPFDAACKEALAEMERDLGRITLGSSHEESQRIFDYILDTFAQNVIDAVKRLEPEFYEVLSRTRLVMYNSGAVIRHGVKLYSGADAWGRNGTITKKLLSLIIARKMNIPYGTYSNSFEGFDSPVDSLVKRIFEDASFIFCRDTDSINYLKSIDIAPPRPPVISYAPDSSFSFPWRDDEWAKSFMAKHGLLPKEFITVTIRATGPKVWNLEGPRQDAQMKKLIQLIENWVRKTGMKVLICPEVKHDIEPAKELIYDKLSDFAKEKSVWMDHFWTTQQAVGVYRHARVVISMEMHSVILTIPEGTPIIHPPFKEAGRKRQMVADVGLGDYLFDIDRVDAESMENALYYIHDHYAEVSEKIQKEVIPYIRDREKNAMDVIGKALEAFSS